MLKMKKNFDVVIKRFIHTFYSIINWSIILLKFNKIYNDVTSLADINLFLIKFN